MAYCTIPQVDKILAQALTTASPTGLTTPGKLINIASTRNLNLIPEADVNYYIRLSDSQINAACSEQYSVPFIEITDIETTLTASIDEYTDPILLDNWHALSPGDTIILTDGTETERAVISAIDLSTGDITTEDYITNVFDSSDTRVLRVRFPDPIPYISARLTAAAIYDRISKAQNEPGKSEYAEIVRKQAIADLNNIREGRTILHGVRRIGWRFANSTLLDRYPLKGTFESDGSRADQGNA